MPYMNFLLGLMAEGSGLFAGNLLLGFKSGKSDSENVFI